MDKLKQMIMERTGISEEQADKAIDTVMDYLKNNPDQLTKLLGDKSPLGNVGNRLGGLLGRD